jgi:hypothetical protein
MAGVIQPAVPPCHASIQIEISTDFYEVTVGISKVERYHLALGAFALDRAEFDGHAAVF